MAAILFGGSLPVRAGLVNPIKTFPLNIRVPQGSALGPFLFSVYTSPIANVISSLGVSFHQYADDTQIYTSIQSDNNSEGVRNLEACCSSVRDWFAGNEMLLNPDKSEVLLVSRKSVAKRFNSDTEMLLVVTYVSSLS